MTPAGRGRLGCAALLLVLSSSCATEATGGATGYSEQACRTTSEGFTVCEPSGPLPAGATPPPAPAQVVAAGDSFAGVPLGTALAEAEPRLRAVLGEPEEATEHSCLRPDRRDSLAQPLRGRRLTWRALEAQAYFTALPSGDTVLTGWRVMATKQPPSRYAMVLPYGVRLEEPADEAKAKVPQGRLSIVESGADTGSRTLTTPALPGFAVDLFERSRGELVFGASFDPEGCRG